VEIDDFIYEQCITYIGSRGEENPRSQGVDRRETRRVCQQCPGGPREGVAHFPYTCLNLIQYNTSNMPI
jgi:hypothetical protein